MIECRLRKSFDYFLLSVVGKQKHVVVRARRECETAGQVKGTACSFIYWR